MITLTNGNIQNASNIPIIPFGSIELYLNSDATLIASPYGQILGGTKNSVRFYFDENADLIQPCQIWSNEELNPQNDEGLGTYYVVNFYDGNGTRLNNGPMIWVFPNDEGATIDIGTMINISAPRVYYPDFSSLGINFADDVIPDGEIDGTTGYNGNPTFTLPDAPNPAASLNLFLNGARMTEGIAFTLDGATITYEPGYIPLTGNTHISAYRY